MMTDQLLLTSPDFSSITNKLDRRIDAIDFYLDDLMLQRHRLNLYRSYKRNLKDLG